MLELRKLLNYTGYANYVKLRKPRKLHGPRKLQELFPYVVSVLEE